MIITINLLKLMTMIISVNYYDEISNQRVRPMTQIFKDYAMFCHDSCHGQFNFKLDICHFVAASETSRDTIFDDFRTTHAQADSKNPVPADVIGSQAKMLWAGERWMITHQPSWHAPKWWQSSAQLLLLLFFSIYQDKLFFFFMVDRKPLQY